MGLYAERPEVDPAPHADVMANMEDERYCFIVEWLDPHSGLTMRYQMLYGPADCSVEMYDIKNRRPFLKKTKIPTVTMDTLHMGVVKPGAVHLAGKVINASQKSGFSVARVKMAQLSSAEASAMFGEASVAELSSGPSMGVSLVGDDAVSSFKALAKELVSSLGDCVVYSES